jgi:hypothetical protein
VRAQLKAFEEVLGDDISIVLCEYKYLGMKRSSA